MEKRKHIAFATPHAAIVWLTDLARVSLCIASLAHQGLDMLVFRMS